MMRALNYATILVLLSICWAPWVSAADLSTEYLHGRWVIDDKNCSSPDSEYIEFNKNGTFAGLRTGNAEIVGFWKLQEGILNLHMVTSPAFFDDLQKQLAGFEGLYSYFQGRMVIFNTQDKAFEAFGVIGDEMKRTMAVKCE